MKDLIIIGASGFGREIAWLVQRINAQTPTWNLLGFIDDNESIQNTCVNGYQVLGPTASVAKYPSAHYVCAIGSAKARKSIIEKIESILSTVNYATLIDPSAIMSDRIIIEPGCMICAGTIITVDVKISKHVIINLDCTIGHDAVINSFVTIYPSVNVSGNTEIKECVEIGTGTQIIQGKIIGESTIVGAGAIVVKDLPPKCTAVGSPAKPIKYFV